MARSVALCRRPAWPGIVLVAATALLHRQIGGAVGEGVGDTCQSAATTSLIVAATGGSTAKSAAVVGDMNTVPLGKDKEEATDRDAAADGDLAALIARTSLSSMGLGAQRPTKSRQEAAGGAMSVGGGDLQKHVIARTDTLAGIAMRYGSSVEELKKLNKLWSERDMFSRTTLVVPVRNELALASERAGKVKAFLGAVALGCDEDKATKVLGKHGWVVDKAVHAYKEQQEADMLKQQQQQQQQQQQRALMSSSTDEELADPSGFFGKVGDVKMGAAKGLNRSDDEIYNEL